MREDRATRRSLLRAGLLSGAAAVLTVVCASPAAAATAVAAATGAAAATGMAAAAGGASAEHPVLSLLTGLVLGVLGGAGAIAWHRNRL